MLVDSTSSDPSNWGPALDAVVAAPAHHRLIYENDRLRVLEVTLEPEAEEPTHHHRWPSVFVLAGRVFNASGKTIHGIRVEMKSSR